MTIVAPSRTESASYHNDPSWKTVTSRFARRQQARRNKENGPSQLPVLMQGPGFQIPVWEIRTFDGRFKRVSYVARAHVKGHVPVGLIDSFPLGQRTQVDVCATSQTTGYIYPSRFEGPSEEGDTSIVIPAFYYEPV